MSRLHCHVDGVAGIAGDMALGALLDLGWPLEELDAGLRALPLEGWTIEAETVDASGVQATRVRVLADERKQPHRGLREIRAIVEGARLPAPVVERSMAVFERICEVEAGIHGVAVDEVHLHEIGAVDSLLDTCGVVLGLHSLGVERLSASAPALGAGSVRTAHGLLPVPAPATLELLRGRPTRGGDLPPGTDAELTTPTGAALLAVLCDAWGEAPAGRVERIGYGAGTRRLPDRPNVVRFTLTHAAEDAALGDGEGASLLVVEADVDDATPERLAAATRALLDAGVRDVTQQSVAMKKGRLGTRVGVVADERDLDRVVALLLETTGSLGCRWHRVRRAECDRDVVTVETRSGTIRVKRGRWHGRTVSVKPEHDDCVEAARRAKRTLREVEAEALEALRNADERET